MPLLSPSLCHQRKFSSSFQNNSASFFSPGFLAILPDVTSRDTPVSPRSSSFHLRSIQWSLISLLLSRPPPILNSSFENFTILGRNRFEGRLLKQMFLQSDRVFVAQKPVGKKGFLPGPLNGGYRKKRQFRANLLSSRSFSSIWDLRTSVAQKIYWNPPTRFGELDPIDPSYSTYSPRFSTGCAVNRLGFASPMHFPLVVPTRSGPVSISRARFRGRFRSEISPTKKGKGNERGGETVSEVPGKVGKSANDFSFRRFGSGRIFDRMEEDSKIFLWRKGKMNRFSRVVLCFFFFFLFLNRVFWTYGSRIHI